MDFVWNISRCSFQFELDKPKTEATVVYRDSRLADFYFRIISVEACRVAQ